MTYVSHPTSVYHNVLEPQPTLMQHDVSPAYQVGVQHELIIITVIIQLTQNTTQTSQVPEANAANLLPSKSSHCQQHCTPGNLITTLTVTNCNFVKSETQRTVLHPGMCGAVWDGGITLTVDD